MKRSELRADIQALRFIAVGLVVLFHLWPTRLTGGFVGVDVFFVISGFLITSHIMKDVANKTFSIIKFWARRIRRLLPASFAVLLVTYAVIILAVPSALWAQWLREVQASLIYAENWVLAADSVDYLALANSASPTQHFWSLAVEEQFYFVWPLIVGLSALLAGKSSRNAARTRTISLVLFATVFVSSLIFGVYLTFTEPSIAYFSTPVRAWEFALGGLVAFMPARKRPVGSTGFALIGLAMIAVTGIGYKASMAFPGWLAIIPVLGTGLLIWSRVDSGWLHKLFGLKLVQFVGDRSYSIYLWHWPIIILLPYVLHHEINTLMRLTILVLSMVMAWISHKFIEEPFISGRKLSFARPRTVFATLAVFTLLISGGITFSQAQNAQAMETAAAKAKHATSQELTCFGAAARAPGKSTCENTKITGIYPSIDLALHDYSFSSKVCGSMKRDDSIPKVCKLGVTHSVTRIALVGDSHMGQYAGAFVKLAKKNKWELEIYWKGGCPFSKTKRVHDAVLGAACDSWIEKSKQLIFSGNYDVVITSMASGVDWIAKKGQSQAQSAETGLAQMWQSLNASGIPVIAIKDNPRPISGQLNCLQMRGLKSCDAKRKTAFRYDPIPGAFNKVKSSLTQLVNFDDIYCGKSICPAVVGHVLVYRGDNHLTNTFTTTLAPYFEPYVLKALKK